MIMIGVVKANNNRIRSNVVARVSSITSSVGAWVNGGDVGAWVGGFVNCLHIQQASFAVLFLVPMILVSSL